ncbi:hypothetical protein FOZ63_005974, partial [Perkinsus olseni]
VTALDASDTAIAEMSRLRHGVEYKQGFADSNELTGGCFNLIIDKGLMDCLMRDGADDTLANATMRQTQRVLQNGGVYVSVSGVPPEQRMPIFSKMAKGARLDDPVVRECLLSRPKLAVAMDGQLFMSKKVYLYACSKPYDSN